MNNRKKVKDIIDCLTRAIEMDKSEIANVKDNINRHLNKNELLKFLLEDTLKELVTLNALSMTKKAI
ncbi:hypothetical protein AST01_02440 [Staphylococcus equorum]|uniref:hypothetical protein n=1 Tax=Staphylococcus equorum TaxID=246432 RepID=UPI0008537ABC|nr:hypothetical protein [Staphylococcus equorum]OEK71091.1 hypothetical protein AST01_02440 [Staphylococcus equorum]